MAAETYMNLGMGVTLKPTSTGRYRIDYHQTDLCLQWDIIAKEKGKAAGRQEAMERAQWYHDHLPELLAKQEAQCVRDLEQNAYGRVGQPIGCL